MTSVEIAAWVQGLAGVATFLAACLAVKATIDAPIKAAEFAEKLRRDKEASDETARQQRQILTILLQYRAQILHYDVFNALNLIDLAFIDAVEVRRAWHQFHDAIENPSSFELKRERFAKIIEAIIRYLNLSDKITPQDVSRAYFPDFVGKQIDVFAAKVEEDWQDLQARRSGPPPRPEI